MRLHRQLRNSYQIRKAGGAFCGRVRFIHEKGEPIPEMEGLFSEGGQGGVASTSHQGPTMRRSLCPPSKKSPSDFSSFAKKLDGGLFPIQFTMLMKRHPSPRYRTAPMLRPLLLAFLVLALAGCDFLGGNDEPAAPRLYPVRIDGSWGYIGVSGRIAVVPRFEAAEDFSEGLGAVQIGGLWGYAGSGGNVRIPPQYRVAGPFSEGLAAVRGDAAYGYVDTKGTLVIDAQFDLAQPFSEDRAAVRIDGRWGFIDKSGALVIEPRFSDARSFSEGFAAVESVDGWVYIDRDGGVVIDPSFTIEVAGDFVDGLAPFATSDGWGYLDRDGGPAVAPRFEQAEPFAEGLAVVAEDGLFGFIDKSGAWAVTPQFREARPFSEGLAAVRLNSRWTFLDKASLRIGMERNFMRAEPFNGGIARIFNGREDDPDIGYIDRRGEYVWFPTK